MNALDLHVHARLAPFDLDVSIATDARSIGLFGPSGAGKTSVLETIVGWRRPASGHVRIGGHTLFDSEAGIDSPLPERGVGYVPQDPLLFPHWTVARNITASRRCDDSFASRVLAALELAPLLGRWPATLSGGEKRRVSLARALCARPRILVLDEPLSALDRTLRARVLSDIVRVRALFDVALVMVSHDPTEIVAACDEVFVLERGRVVASGRPGTILRERTLVGDGFENVLMGIVRDVDGRTARVALDRGPSVFATVEGARPGERVWLGLDAEDVLLSEVAPTRISARNVLPALVAGITDDHAGSVRVALRLSAEEAAPSLCAAVTRAAVTELALDHGRAVHVVFKANSCRVVARGQGQG